MPAAPRHAAEDVAAADHDRHLHTQLRDFGDLIDHALDGGTVDAEGIVAHQGFAGQFEQDALVGWHGHLGLVLIARLNGWMGAGGTSICAPAAHEFGCLTG
jgi:hypothetical protein